MKGIKISDDVHAWLTGRLGLLIAKSEKQKTYDDALRALMNQAILLPEELVGHIQQLIANKELGYTNPEEFVREAVRDKLATIIRKARPSKSAAEEKA
jgi:hypothetical protein